MGPAELVRNQGLPTGLATNGVHLWWANEEEKVIARCPIAGCPVAERTIIATGQTKPTGVAVTADSVLWAAEESGMRFVIRRCPLEGCAPTGPIEVVADTGKAWGIAVASTNLYFAATDRLIRCPIAACSKANQEVLASASGRITGVAVNATHFYFFRSARGATNPGIFRCPTVGCGLRSADEDQIASGVPGAISLAVDDRSVYWTDNQMYWPPPFISFWSHRVDSCPLAGCAPYAPTTVASGEIAPWGVTTFGDYFFWTEMQKGRITRVPKVRR